MYVSIYWIYDQHQPTMWYADRRGVELTNKYGDIHVVKTSIWLVIYPKHSQTIYPYKHSNSNSHQPVPTIWAAEKNTVRVCWNAINSNLFVTVLLQQTTSWTNPWSGAIPLQSSQINPNDLNLMPGFQPIDSKQTKWAVFNSVHNIPVGSLSISNHMIIPSRFQ